MILPVNLGFSRLPIADAAELLTAELLKWEATQVGVNQCRLDSLIPLPKSCRNGVLL